MQLENKTVSISLFERLVDVMPYGIIIANSNSEFILHNSMAQKYFDSEIYATTETRWQGEYGLYTLDKGYKYKNEDTPTQKALKGEVVQQVKYFVVSKSKPEGVYLKVSSYPIYDLIDISKVEAAVIVFEDITKEQTFFDDIGKKFEEMEIYLKEVLKVEYPPKKEINETERAY